MVYANQSMQRSHTITGNGTACSQRSEPHIHAAHVNLFSLDTQKAEDGVYCTVPYCTFASSKLVPPCIVHAHISFLQHSFSLTPTLYLHGPQDRRLCRLAQRSNHAGRPVSCVRLLRRSGAGTGRPRYQCTCSTRYSMGLYSLNAQSRLDQPGFVKMWAMGPQSELGHCKTHANMSCVHGTPAAFKVR